MEPASKQLAPIAASTTQALSMQCLGQELDLTATMAKINLDRCVADEFKRVFIFERLQPPEAILWAFRRWRDESNFFPATFDISERIKLWHAEQRAQQEEQEREAEKAARKDGQRVGLEELRDILGRYVEAKPKPAYTPPSPEELKRRREVQLKALEEKYGRKPAV